MGIDLPKLDDIGYKELRKAAQAKLPKSAPTWDDHNLSDPGITFLEFFSWLSDVELYRLNRVTPEHLKKFLALLGDRYPGTKAAGGVIVRNEGVDAGLQINAGSTIEVDTGGKKKVFRTLSAFYGNPAEVDSITVLKNNDWFTTRSFDKNRPIEPFYAFGETPKSSNLFRLNLNKAPSKHLKLYIDLVESDLPSYAADWEKDYAWLKTHDSVELEWYLKVGSQAYLMIPHEDSTLNLRYSGTITFILDAIVPADENDDTQIECRLKRSSYTIAPFIKGIYLNTIEVEQAESVTQSAYSTGEALQTLLLEKQGVLDGDGAGVSIETRDSAGNIASWKRVDSLHGSRGSDKHYVYDNVTRQVHFGDGRHGALIPETEQIICRYSVSEGSQGEVPLTLVWPVAEGMDFYNFQPILGGSDPADYEERFAAIAANWRKPSQAVTLDDYETLAKAAPGLRVARAKATADSTANHISVTVVPYSRSNYAVPDDFFCARVCRFLDTRRLITTRISVEKPRYTRVGVDVRIKARVSFDEESIRLRMIRAIDDYLHPLYGGDDRQGWPFGRAVYLSDIYALLEPIEGVDCVLTVTFNGEGNYDGIKKAYVIAPESLIRMTTHRVTFMQSSIACGGAA
jgi:predicted phage baseplate assembly protein